MARVAVQGVWKEFQLRQDRADSVGSLLWQMVPGRRRRRKAEPFWALRDISFETAPGESLGVVGNNGSGKSTLLKILTRTMLPTRGTVAVEGRLSALIELGAGFHPDFTGRENVILNASILGIRRREIEAKMDEIVAFAEIPAFMDTPVKYYSSGMHARLGFAVATAVDPEVLIVDEVLAVGDEAFQQKCMDRIFGLKRQGVSILLVSHALDNIERLMDQAVWIDRGVMRAQGKPRDVVMAYRQSLLGQSAGGDGGEPERTATVLELLGVAVHGAGAGERVASGSRLTVELHLQNDGPTFRGHLELVMRRPDGLEVVKASTLLDGDRLDIGPGRHTVRLELPEVWLASGRYEIDGAILNGEGRRLDLWPSIAQVEMQAMTRSGGLLALPHRWEVR